MSKPKPSVYRTTNWHDYNKALARRGSLSIWFNHETQWLAAPTGRRGRQPVFTDAAIQVCLTLKALFGLPLRQTTGMVASLLGLAGLDWPVPDYSTLCRRQKTLTVHVPYRPSTGALHLLIDSTGEKAEGDGEWLAKKHGPSKPRDWRKVHLGIDAETLEIRAIEITGSRVGDAPMLPDLLDQIPPPKPGRGQDALLQASGRACHVPRFRPPGRRTSDQGRHPQPLHRTRNTRYATRRIGLSKGRGTPTFRGFAQQSPHGASNCYRRYLKRFEGFGSFRIVG